MGLLLALAALCCPAHAVILLNFTGLADPINDGPGDDIDGSPRFSTLTVPRWEPGVGTDAFGNPTINNIRLENVGALSGNGTVFDAILTITAIGNLTVDYVTTTDTQPIDTQNPVGGETWTINSQGLHIRAFGLGNSSAGLQTATYTLSFVANGTNTTISLDDEVEFIGLDLDLNGGRGDYMAFRDIASWDLNGGGSAIIVNQAGNLTTFLGNETNNPQNNVRGAFLVTYNAGISSISFDIGINYTAAGGGQARSFYLLSDPGNFTFVPEPSTFLAGALLALAATGHWGYKKFRTLRAPPTSR